MGFPFYSISLTRQWALGMLLAVAPLIVAVGYAIWSMDKHNRRQNELVESTAAINRQMSALQELVKELERSARQFVVLQDARFEKIYGEKYAKLQEQATALERNIGSAKMSDMVSQLLRVTHRSALSINSPAKRDAAPEQLSTPKGVEAEETLNEVVGPEFEANSLGRLTAIFNSAAEITSNITALANEAMNASLAEQKEGFRTTQWWLAILGLLALPASFVIMVIWSYVITRPLNNLSQTIRRIGEGELEGCAKVEGPEEFQVLGKRLEWLRENLELIEQQKSAFLRHVTHELKTPLAAIFEASALLTEEIPGPLTGEQRKVVGILFDNAIRLQEMIQQLLNFNSVRLAAGGPRQTLELPEFLHKSIERYRSLANANQVYIEIPKTSIAVESDPVLLEMIFNNLLSNAIHFSPPGSRIALGWGNEDADGEQPGWWLEVRDQGPGISKHDKEKIFTPFFQGDNKRQGATKGSGLGLAIVAECLRHLGGDIQVMDEEPNGTRFYISFTDYT
ncbi:HAMP domain-containing protein [Hahella sp. KA22]|uniref:sensor histidine kinase n=1 Tax=Hahella sp. KA22 TaxID=1628392 RepID=UPI000FDCF235|nr:HAMP domain-containing sensor histidine kinase [Hahella sp. KA22]AZZ93966.1 HAMP domain-containing histidine kinase [Hahella sp. KA22]QAY57340.1 HAMP domain-containing protein [Hahella sp. KA22]